MKTIFLRKETRENKTFSTAKTGISMFKHTTIYVYIRALLSIPGRIYGKNHPPPSSLDVTKA
jgi:hypothetical protein